MIRWAVDIALIIFVSILISNAFDFNLWLCLIGVTFVGYFLSKRFAQKYQIKNLAKNEAVKSAFDWPSVGNFECEVVGESHYQVALNKLKGSTTDIRLLPPFTAFLIPENSNKFDKLAVRVDINGMTVGYLNKEDAREYRKILKQKNISDLPTSCDATLTGGFVKDDGSLASFGVCLDIDIYGDNDESDD